MERLRARHGGLGFNPFQGDLLLALLFVFFGFIPLWGTSLLFGAVVLRVKESNALLGVGYFFGHWYLDLAVLWAFMLFAPLFGIWVFQGVERSIKRNEGVGQF